MNTPSSTGGNKDNPLAIRGLLIDAARMPESIAYYRRVIEFCSQWGFNTILLRLTDDQGCALRFASHPDIITHPNALTPEEARGLVAYASQRGVDIIPEIESFGHCSCITGVARYRELRDDDTVGDHAVYSGLIPVHPGTRALMADLYRETASIFPSRFLHGGCDEINWGGSAMSKEAIARDGRPRVWADYVNHLAGVAKSLGRSLIIWADHVLRKEGGTLEMLDKEIILHDWDYWTHEPAELKKHADRALAAGLRLIGGPAMNWCRWGPRVGAPQLYNMNAFADTYRGLAGADPRVLGLIVTHWVPGRYMSGAQWDHFAYAAVAMRDGGAAAYDGALREFVERHFNAPWDALWSDALLSLYHFTPSRHCCSPAWTRPVLPLPWSSDEEFRSHIAARPGQQPPFDRILSQLDQCVAGVKANRQDFDDLRLCVRYLAHLHERQEAVGRMARGEVEAKATIERVARRDAELLAALDDEWNRHRPSDAPGKAASLTKLKPQDQMLAAFRRAAGYSAQLAADPARLSALLAR